MIILLAALALGSAPMNDAAVVRQTSREYQSCSRTEMTEMEQISCILPELQRQDQLLRKATDDTIKSLPPRKKATFRRLQRNWSRHRTEKCARDSKRATNVSVKQTQCMLFETVRRTEWLKKYR